MRVVRCILALAASVAAASVVTAQNGSVNGPSWAYGLPPVSTPPPPATTAAAGQSPGPARAPDTSLKHIPDSAQAFSLPQLRDFFNVADWFPSNHPPMPEVFVHGRAPDVLGCGMCHMPNGKGRPENAPIAGLPFSYVVQQLLDFKNDRRTSADARKTNTALMIKAAKAMTDDEIKIGRVVPGVDAVDALDPRGRDRDGPEDAPRRERVPAAGGGRDGASATGSLKHPRMRRASSCAIRTRDSSPTCRGEAWRRERRWRRAAATKRCRARSVTVPT